MLMHFRVVSDCPRLSISLETERQRLYCLILHYLSRFLESMFCRLRLLRSFQSSGHDRWAHFERGIGFASYFRCAHENASRHARKRGHELRKIWAKAEYWRRFFLPSQHFLRLVFRVKSLGGILVRQQVVLLVLGHAGATPHGTFARNDWNFISNAREIIFKGVKLEGQT